ncbi:hypothetical protein LS70_002200 [Helicobacter sp. MIT 11-5569]|uniref:T6SS effector amidase Tae4 family protein n=1 Tax=Helicobacter sp. MIT 11-5569 TaxID=1548151 RepID=UPI00051FAD20|nr:T6SS effector amidase Tae4 family protein [Helicobacter sp. MIT 11-5569]TLD84381.1 hypothetical protein LS70_002200 [Helicobacter sp. MIT 11-5569]
MSITIAATCGGKCVTIKIQRPSFESVKKAYEEISRFDISAYIVRKNALYDELYERAKSEGKSDKEAHEFADIESLWVVSIEFAEPRYRQVGGKVEELFNNDKRTYVNTCALRISYALNHSTHPINTMDKQVTGRGYKGEDKQTYYLGVFDIIEFLKLNWKELTWAKPTYAQVKEEIKCGCSKDFYHKMETKEQNIQFFKELQSIQRKGIIAMVGSDGLRHTTLWEIDNFVDVALGVSANYLNETAYIIRDLYFWDLIG